MLVTLSHFLGLILALFTEPPSCAPLIEVTFDNTTVPQLLGRWFYIVGASKYPPYRAEMRAEKEIRNETYEAFSFSPGSHEDELNITEIIRTNETCVVRNSRKVQVSHQNSTLMHVDDNDATYVVRLIQNDKDLLILNHINVDFPTLTLSARTPNVSKEHLEEFRAHLHCLGFTEEEVFYTATEYVCHLPEKQTGEGNANPQQE